MNLGFIGTGKIASSVITGISNSKISYKKIIISPRNIKIAKNLKKKFKKITIAKNNQQVIDQSDWIFLSIDEAIDTYKNYCSKGRTDVFDIAYRYAGMGYIRMLACDLNTHLLFIRMDGGSSGWDREYNYNDLIKNGSDAYPKINFTQWINIFSQSIYD